jgi:hypothetical protein
VHFNFRRPIPVLAAISVPTTEHVPKQLPNIGTGSHTVVRVRHCFNGSCGHFVGRRRTFSVMDRSEVGLFEVRNLKGRIDVTAASPKAASQPQGDRIGDSDGGGRSGRIPSRKGG